MSRVLASIFLYLSPVIITVAVGIVGVGMHAIGRGFGSTRSHAPIAIAAVIVWLLHGGFLLAPWFYATDRRTLAAWLMLPVAVLGTVASISGAKQLLPSHPDDYTPATLVCTVLWALAVIFGYIVPVIVMLVQPRFVAATH